MKRQGAKRTQRAKASVKPVPGLDSGIGPFVEILRNNGIETFESCQGGRGHAYPEPTIRFHGSYGDGFKALAIALDHALPVSCLRRIWMILNNGEPTGPSWELVFWRTADQVTCLRYRTDVDRGSKGNRGCTVRRRRTPNIRPPRRPGVS